MARILVLSLVTALCVALPGVTPGLADEERSLSTLEKLAARVEQDPEDAMALAQYGFALIGTEREDEGFELLSQADVLGFEEPRVQIIVARAYMKAENFGEASLVASRVYESALAGRDDKAEAAFIGGSARWRVGDFPSAEELFQRALRLKPDHGPSLVNLGLLLYSTSRAAQGIATLQKAAQVDPENPRTAIRVAGAFEGMGRHELALPLRERVVELLPESVGARKSLIQVCMTLKKREQAIPHLRFLAEAEPEVGLHRVMLAQNLLALGRAEEALDAAEAAVALDESAQPLLEQAREMLAGESS